MSGEQPSGNTGFFVQSFTAQDMVNLALKNASLLGVGQSALPEDINDAFNLLNGMLGIWSRKRWLIWHLVDVSAPVVSGQQSYTIGPGANIDAPRPDRIEAAYFRQFITGGQSPVDFPLDVYQAREDYATVALKFLQSWPQAMFYDAAIPNGLLYPVPIPNVPNSELHVLIKDTLSQFPTLTTVCNLPPEYFEAIWSNLALRVAAAFPGSNLSPLTVGLAKASLTTIRGANAQVPRLRMPQILVRPPLYNIFSGQTY